MFARFLLPTAAIVVAAALGFLALAGQDAGAEERRREPPVPRTVEVLRDLEYGTGGGRPLLLDLYRPRTRSAEARPAVVLIHGGGWTKGDKSQVFGAVALASRGMVAVSVNYRLSGEAPFPAAVEDCACAVRWLRAHAREYGVDPEKIGAWGSSAGGQIALVLAYAGPEAGLEGNGGWSGQSGRVQAVCSWFGPTDLRIVEIPPRQYLGGTVREVPEQYALASAVTHVSPEDPPTFLAHGDQDRVVPIEQSRTLRDLLMQVGVPVELLTVENGGHGFKPMNGGTVEFRTSDVEGLSAEFFARMLRAS